ncbi:hypothetical protein CDV36_006927 [Fusarium kuroshium]|uniref:Actin-like ATPase domain-containing protein n=1 Tax=Fusarium kuroshium TaxID=2010991 RepID=A0A3M2S776_9HYPO|nr:hypothetical protein CDV36_006927 [Fusarium kuroshium]
MPSSLSSEIVVGIDFGTTQKRIRLITDWPNPAATIANADKVPTVISYENGRVVNWGYEVGLKEDAFRWIKILLEPKSKYADEELNVQGSSNLLNKVNKTVEEVVSDYLRLIWKYTKEDIRKRVGDNHWEDNFTLQVVLTVPAMWSHVAKDKTLKAAKKAGLPQDIRLVTEPEAAALATLHDKAEENSLKKGDAFVVCDAGGGTVDLISYKVNNTSPLEIEECAIGDGDLCGSTRLDKCFEKYIETLVGKDQYSRIKDINKKKMMRVFEYGVKRCFTLESTREYTVDLKGVPDNQRHSIEDDTITLDHSMLRTLFDHVFGQIETLVQNQTEEVESNGLKVKSILLVGGFGSSKYLHHRLENSYRSRGISVLQVDGAWSSICRGACRWGLEHALGQPNAFTPAPVPTVIGRISKYSYGVCVSQPFDSSRHRLDDQYLNLATNTYYAANQMEWLLLRGEKVTEGRILSTEVLQRVHGVGFFSTGERSFADQLFYCQDNEPPTRFNNNVKQLCSVNYSVEEEKIWHEDSYRSDAQPGKWRTMTMKLFLILGNATLDFRVKYRNEYVATVEAEYVQDFS